MCDIDHFKAVNDLHGHQAGDEVLRGFASLLKGSIRQNVDWVARYGGEEFVLVLPETDARGAYAVAERLRQTVAKEQFRIQGKGIRVTASLGISGIDPRGIQEGLSSDALLNEADQCLLYAKRSGRNMVWVSSTGKGGTTMRRKRSHG
jgi:diguanylate cyclase (GGDEF)-like protein